MPAPITGNDIKSTHKSAALLEVAMSLQASEFAVPEETRPNNITVTFDAEARTASVTATLPVTFTADVDGKPVIAATDYIP
ncbi:hypothetical protein CAL7716_072300 [Calothrix sp. PCC 7716]|nr:hypothetical protein CAL7716_072300 [Calothrix sp. PCC 7716]